MQIQQPIQPVLVRSVFQILKESTFDFVEWIQNRY